MLTGSIFTIGTQYVVTLEAVIAASGDTLAEERAEARGEEQVLSALGKAAERMRKRLGESLASIQQFGKPLEQVTTCRSRPCSSTH